MTALDGVDGALDVGPGDDPLRSAVLADIGGGTSDFSIVRVGPRHRGRPDRKHDVLATAGVRVGGTDGELSLQGRNLIAAKYIAFTEPDPDGNSYQPAPKQEAFLGLRVGLGK